MALEGYPGSGKTTLEYYLGKEIDPNFNLDENMVYVPESDEIINKFNALKQYSVLAVDEGARGMYKLQWMNPLQQKLNQLYMTERKQNKATLICIPRFNDLNEFFRNYRISFRIWVITRGVAVLHAKDEDKDISDPWHIKDAIKIKSRLYDIPVAERDPGDILDFERRLPTYVMDFKFPAMPPEVERIYKEKALAAKLAAEQNLNAAGKLNKKQDRWKLERDVLAKYIYEKMGLKKVEIAKIIGHDPTNISDVIPSTKKLAEPLRAMKEELKQKGEFIQV